MIVSNQIKTGYAVWYQPIPTRFTHEVTTRESSTATPLSKALRNDVPQLQKVANVWNIGGAQIHIPIPSKDFADEKRVKQNDGLYWAEPELFSMFDYAWLAGNAKKLNEPNVCALNETLLAK